MATFALDPHVGNDNPGSTEVLKLYNKVIDSPEEKLEINQCKICDIQTIFNTMQRILVQSQL